MNIIEAVKAMEDGKIVKKLMSGILYTYKDGGCFHNTVYGANINAEWTEADFSFNDIEAEWEVYNKLVDYHLTQDDKDMLRILKNNDYHWIARDRGNDTVYFYQNKPYINSTDEYYINYGRIAGCKLPLFKEITFENSPVNIDELLSSLQ